MSDRRGVASGRDRAVAASGSDRASAASASDRGRILAIVAVLSVGLVAGTVVAVAVGGAAAQTADASENVSREGGELVVRVPTDATGDRGNATAFAVGAPATNTETTVNATREGDRYVGRLPVTAIVPPDATENLSAATVRVGENGSAVAEGVVDLRYVAQTGPPRFRNATLVLPVDVRGLGDGGVELVRAANGTRLPTTLASTGPNETIAIGPAALADLPTNRTIETTVRVDNDTVPAALSFEIEDAAARSTTMRTRNGDLQLVQPLAYPSIGPERVDLTLETWQPRGLYHRRVAAENVTIDLPESIRGANRVRVTVTGQNRTLLDAVRVSVPSRRTVSLRIDDGALSAPAPERLSAYDAIVLRTETTTHVPIEPSLRRGGTQSLPARLVEDGEYVGIDRGPNAILVGEDVAPATVDLTVVPPPNESAPVPDQPDPDEDAFIGLWLDIGSVVGLLFVAMVGSVVAVGGIYGVRRFAPARAAAANGRAVLAHFMFGGICGIYFIAAFQSAYGEPQGGVRLLGTTLGLGALLVGGFHGGLTATGLRLGLGTVGAWPTRRVVDETAVPVRIRFTDHDGAALPGEQHVEVRNAGDGTLVDDAGLAGTTTEIDLAPGKYVVRGHTAERETEPVDLVIGTPSSPTPETRSVELAIGRPGLQFEVTDAATGDPVSTGQVTVTTDRDETRTAEIEDGSVATPLPITTGTVSAVVTAPDYDDATVDVAIEEELTTVDVALDPAAGTLVVSALVTGDPIEGATVGIEPAESAVDADDYWTTDDGAAGNDERSDDGGAPRDVGVRHATVTTDEVGSATVELPAGDYRASLQFDGPNAELFASSDGEVTVQPGEDASIAVYGRFDWSLPGAVERRADGLESTIRSVEAEATADPTIPLYFAGAAEALLACVASLPDAGHRFATSEQDPDVVARATVAAAEAALEAVGQAMQSSSVRPILATDGQPVRVSPELDAAPGDLLDYLDQGLTIASVEARAHEVEQAVDEADDELASVAPARAVVEKALELVPDDRITTDAAIREFAALLLLDAVEQSLKDGSIRRRLDGSARDR